MHDPLPTLARPANSVVRSRTEIKASELRELMMQRLSYIPETGEFWHIRSGNGTVSGNKAGSFTKKGYAQISFQHKSYAAHRIAWLFVYGNFPDEGQMVDHINGVRNDNRISNLRVVTCAENLQNRRSAGVRSSTGLLGVITHGKGIYSSRICVNGVLHRLGCFATPELAHEAYVKAKRQMHKTCTI